MLNLCLAEFSSFALAYLGVSRSSSSSIGVLGCLVFGLLFWKEKQNTAANAASLEDVQLCIRKAETELNTQTRSSIGYKLEECHLGMGNEHDILQHDALKCQILSVKSIILEKKAKLQADKHVSEICKQQVRSLAVSLEKLKNNCSSLMAYVDRQSSFRQGLKVEIQSVDANLNCKADHIGSLTIAVAEQEQACKKLMEEYAAVETLLDILNIKSVDLKAEFENLRGMVHTSISSMELLLKDVDVTAAKHKTLEAKFKELSRSLQHERASFERFKAEQNESLTNKEKEAAALFAELKCKQDELDRDLYAVVELTSERDELDRLSQDKKSTIVDLRQALSSDLENKRILGSKMSSFLEKLQHEQTRSGALYLDSRENSVLRELRNVSFELNGQLKTQRQLTGQLRSKVRVARETLHLLRAEILDFRGSIQLISSCHSNLQTELARCTEVHKALSQALKREKRVASYARKQTMLTTKSMMGEKEVMEELNGELEKVMKIIGDSKLQILLQAKQLQQVLQTEKLLTDDVLSLRNAVTEKQRQQVHFGENNGTTVAKSSRRTKPAARNTS